MVEPRVPGRQGADLTLPCGETKSAYDLDMGMREFACSCGETHAVVMDVHPPTRFLPEFLVEALREAIETTDEFGEFGTPHLLGLVLEEFPEQVVVRDMSGDGTVGYGLVWVTGFDSRRLHEIIVELVIELMDHAMGHTEDGDAMAAFEDGMYEFDVAAFVEEYRADRDLTADDVPGYGSGS